MAKLQIPVTKGKASVEIETDELSAEVYAEAMLQGLKVLVNRGMSKVTAKDISSDDDRKATAMKIAEENVEAIKAGKIKFSGAAKTKKASGAVMTEARRIARNMVKDEMKRLGIKVSHVPASEITKAANAYIDADPAILEQAEAAIADRGKVKVAGVDLRAILVEDPKLVAAAEAKKAKPKDGGQLSAKQAGLASKSKPKAVPSATAH